MKTFHVSILQETALSSLQKPIKNIEIFKFYEERAIRF